MVIWLILPLLALGLQAAYWRWRGHGLAERSAVRWVERACWEAENECLMERVNLVLGEIAEYDWRVRASGANEQPREHEE